MGKKRKLNIAIFHLAFVYSGGGEKLVLKEAEGLQKLGHKITIYTCCLDKSKCFPDLIKNVKIYEFLPWTKFFFKNHETFRVLISCLLVPLYSFKFRKYDLIFAANQPSLWIAYVIKILFKKKYVGYLAQPTRFLHPREIDKETGLYFTKKETESISFKLMQIFKRLIKKLDNLSIKNADKVLVNGDYMSEVINKIYKIKSLSCPAGANYTNKPVLQKLKNKKPYILMTNRHAWQKRFEYGLTAFSGFLTKYPEYNLIITGAKTSYTEELIVLVNRLGLKDKVVFTGLLKDKELEKLYRDAAVYLYTAPEEDFGMGVIEAMGMGTPVIAWDKAGPSKTVLNNKTGFLIKPYNIDLFTKTLINTVFDKKKMVSLSTQGINRIKSKYSWKKHFLKLEYTIQNLIE